MKAVINQLIEAVIATLQVAKNETKHNVSLVLAPQNEKPFMVALKRQLEETYDTVLGNDAEVVLFLASKGLVLNISHAPFQAVSDLGPFIATSGMTSTIIDRTPPPNPSISHHDAIIEQVLTQIKLADGINKLTHIVLFVKKWSVRSIKEKLDAALNAYYTEMTEEELAVISAKGVHNIELFQKPEPYETDGAFLHINGRQAEHIYYEQE